MIVELHEEVWKNMTADVKTEILAREDVRVRLFDTTRTKKGLQKVDRGFVDPRPWEQ